MSISSGSRTTKRASRDTMDVNAVFPETPFFGVPHGERNRTQQKDQLTRLTEKRKGREYGEESNYAVRERERERERENLGANFRGGRCVWTFFSNNFFLKKNYF